MYAVITWWLIVEIMGLAALPLAFRLFKALPDRGYALSKPLALLLSGYVFWILVSFGFLTNKASAALFVVLLVAALSVYIYLRDEGGLLTFARENMGLILITEAIFTLAFGLWVLVRAYNPEIAATEKPMDFAFLNSILRSHYFPPLDPWLSGYAISYYYFGYLMMAMLTTLSGLYSSVTFNLGIALLFALTVSGTFSLVYNLVSGHGGKKVAIYFAILGLLLLAVVGNLEGTLEVFHNQGYGSEALWHWLDIKDLAQAPVNKGWHPTDNWWWWRASRVVHDVVFGRDMEVIDEFPFFSFLLGDMHPHLLALPFFILALGLAFALLRSQERTSWPRVASIGFIVGATGFLNTWDLPTCLVIVICAYALMRKQATLGEVATFAFRVAALSILFYLPFYVRLRSQAGGVLPVLFVKTSLRQYLIMFGLFLFILIPFLLLQLRELIRRNEYQKASRTMAKLWGTIILSPFLLLPPVLLIVLLSPQKRAFIIDKWREFMPGRALDLLSLAWTALFQPLLSHPWLVPLLAALMSIALYSLWQRRGEEKSSLFALLLLFLGLSLTFLCEFLYIQDVFWTRMNTVFKFYYQAWVLLSISSAFGIYYLHQKAVAWHSLRRGLYYLWLSGFLLLFAASLVYSVFATYSKANNFDVPPTLDGLAYLKEREPDDYAAIQWLRENVAGSPVILEAPGGSYTYFGRVSANTGLPTLLGWGGHELQWRGNYDEPAKREPDIEKLYVSPDDTETLALMEKYHIEYVYLGSLEMSKYNPSGAALEKWGRLADIVFQQGRVTIYRRR